MYKKLLSEVIKYRIAQYFGMDCFDVILNKEVVVTSCYVKFKSHCCDSDGNFHVYNGYVGFAGDIEVTQIDGHYLGGYIVEL